MRPGPLLPSFAGWALSIPVVAWFLWRVADIPNGFPLRQGSFGIYYRAAGQLLSGNDPYDTGAFLYPPATLVLFLPFAALEYRQAFILYLLLKSAALVALFGIWLRVFVPRTDAALFLGWSLLAFNSAVYFDITEGNVSIFEQLLLWSGFWLFLRGRIGGFCACVLLASMFKGFLAAFLGMLLFEPRHRAALALSVGLLLAFGLGTYAMAPELSAAFLRSISRLASVTSVSYDPTLRHLIVDWLALVSEVRGIALPGWWASLVWLGFMALAVGISWRAARGLQQAPAHERRLEIVVLACLVYAVSVPRLLPYSHIILIVPAFRAAASQARPLALLLLGAAALPTGNPMLRVQAPFFWGYQVLLVLITCWGLQLLRLRSGAELTTGPEAGALRPGRAGTRRSG
jgi:hypothetical protein